MENVRMRVYCAGPLFNKPEREEMTMLAKALEKAGFETFLPHRDGLELTACVDKLVCSGLERDRANKIMSEAVFALDVFQVLQGCDVIVANLNGRVPDEGTVSEAAIAWSRGKPVVGYKTDSRTAFGGQDNPLVAGLFDFDLCDSTSQVVARVKSLAQSRTCPAKRKNAREHEIASQVQLGSAIWQALCGKRGVEGVVEVLCNRDPQEARTLTA
jgi:nucleoside 2-deoxyribosyltransferase